MQTKKQKSDISNHHYNQSTEGESTEKNKKEVKALQSEMTERRSGNDEDIK